MMKPMIFGAALFASGVAVAAGGTHWSYEGAAGPEHWGQLTAEYGACSGANQSPVNLSRFIDARLPPLVVDYRAGGYEAVNNGHTVQINFTPGSTITVDGRPFTLKQFHVHAPSENWIDGRSFPMEAHLVHADADGHLAVIAVMFTEGAENAALKAAWSRMPAHEGEAERLALPLAGDALLPADRQYYRFAGSLTTPPCTEGVIWLVMQAPVTASEDQIRQFAKVMHHPNNRPLQPLNARVVLR